MIRLQIVCLFLGLASAVMAQEPKEVKDEKQAESADLRSLLEKGRTAGALPDGMIIRLGACLGEPITPPSGKPAAELFVESWEFTSTRIHRVEPETKDGEVVYRQVESRSFDSKNLCHDLLEGKALAISTRQGTGPETVLAGTPFGRGSRAITVVWNGRTLLDLHETNGPALDAYKESDARAFGALYERLASQARSRFKSKDVEAK